MTNVAEQPTAEIAAVDTSGWGACTECGQDLPDGGDLCEQHYQMRANALARHLTPAELVAVHRQAEADIRAGFALVKGGLDAIDHAFAGSDSRSDATYRFQESRGDIDWRDPDRALTRMRRTLWHVLVERIEIRRFMSVAAFDQLEKQIDHGECPELTEESIAAMTRQFSERAPAMLEEAVGEVFEFLRPHDNEYKRNSQFEVPRRVALTWVIDTWYVRNSIRPGLQPTSFAEQRLTALENVFTSLDGKGSTTKGHYSALSQAIRATSRGERGATDYFAFRGYANGALHLEFLRLDLLERFNQIAGGARLRSKASTP